MPGSRTPRLLGLTAAGTTGAAVGLPLGRALAAAAPSATVAVAVGLAVLALGLGWLARRRTTDANLREAERVATRRRAVVHELTGPLSVALAHADLVTEDPALPQEHRASLASVVRSVHRTLSLVGDLASPSPEDLDGSERPTEQGEPGLTTATVDLAALTREAVADVAPLAARRQVAVSVDAPGPAPVLGDASRLRQVVDNLLSNAVKYASDAGWVDVLVTTTEPPGHALLQVSNAGTTLTPDEAEHAFEAQFRAAATTDSSTPGAGIGLSVVQDLVARHAGTVELTSDPEAGTTTVTVILRSAHLPAAPVHA